jgi:hypothetical protein
VAAKEAPEPPVPELPPPAPPPPLTVTVTVQPLQEHWYRPPSARAPENPGLSTAAGLEEGDLEVLGEAPVLSVGVPVGETEGVPEGVGQITTFAVLPSPQPAGQVQATQVAMVEAPVAALKVPGAHRVGAEDPSGQYPPAGHRVPAAALAGQKNPAGHGTDSRVYLRPEEVIETSEKKQSPRIAPKFEL